MSSAVCWARFEKLQLTGPEIFKRRLRQSFKLNQSMQAARDSKSATLNLKRNGRMEFEVWKNVLIKLELPEETEQSS
ncbi:hypothetical protein Tco_0842279 [Tanacetum coccineum]|uniref:Uncharacterized protein n=1 Tax=Tanacetum coccineum TaxID=301880 RepID=A0ABQ5B0Z6_9ASTR